MFYFIFYKNNKTVIVFLFDVHNIAYLPTLFGTQEKNQVIFSMLENFAISAMTYIGIPMPGASTRGVGGVRKNHSTGAWTFEGAWRSCK